MQISVTELHNKGNLGSNMQNVNQIEFLIIL